MKIYRSLIPFALVLLSLLSVSTAVVADDAGLSAEEIEHLYFMREEEKVARDVYRVLYAEWGATVFANIAESEQRHMDAMRDLIERYGLTDPVVDDSVGVFANPELAALYAELVQRGRQSLIDALYVGALIEEVDIEDIQHAIEETDDALIRYVYENLLRGSRNHLRAFASNIEAEGLVYEAQYIAPELVEAILSTPQEPGIL
jgi:hypothetical protein